MPITTVIRPVPTDIAAVTATGHRFARRCRARPGVTITSVTPVRDANGEIRYFRHGTIVTHWEIKHELPGRLRLKNPVIHRKAELCQAIERELMGVLGIDYFKTNPLTSTVLVQYDRKQLSRDQIIEILETALAQRRAPRPERQARPAPAAVHGLGTRGRRSRSSRRRRSCPPPRCCLPTRRSRPSRRRARSCSRRGGWGSTCWTRSSWSAVWEPWRFSREPSSAGA